MPGIGELYLGKYGAEFVDKGVRIGSTEGQADQFIADVIAFFKRSP